MTEHKLRIAIKPANRYQTHFVNTQADTKKLCEDIGHPGFGVLCGMFHAISGKKPLLHR